MKVGDREREREAVTMSVRVREEGGRNMKRLERGREKDIRLCERGILRVRKRNIGR